VVHHHHLEKMKIVGGCLLLVGVTLSLPTAGRLVEGLVVGILVG